MRVRQLSWALAPKGSSEGRLRRAAPGAQSCIGEPPSPAARHACPPGECGGSTWSGGPRQQLRVQAAEGGGWALSGSCSPPTLTRHSCSHSVAHSPFSTAAAVPGSPVPSEGTREPFLIGVCGGTASGKTTVCDRIMHQLQERRVVLISQARGAAQAEAPRVGGSARGQCRSVCRQCRQA